MMTIAKRHVGIAPTLVKMLALLGLAAPLTGHAQVHVPVKIYAQELVDRTVAQHPDLRAVVMHVTPPNAADNVIVASSIGRIGKSADADDREVLATGKTRIEMDRGNKRIEVELALRDVGGDTVGALGLVWRYPVGGNHAEFERTANAIRDALELGVVEIGRAHV